MPLCFRKTLGGPPNRISLFDLAPRGVCLAAPVARRAGELLPHHFTHHLDKRGWSIFCCTCRRSGLSPGARTLSGSLPFGVRTFLFCTRQKRLPGPLHYTASIS